MPEIVNSLEIRKGPYFADVGDFGSVGALNIGLMDSTPKNTASLTVGSFGYQRLFGMNSTPAGDGNLFFAGEVSHYDGPWQNPDDARKVDGIVRYSEGSADNGFTVTGMAYANKWNSTDQVPLRAITSGELDRFGEIDPTDGGNANRFSLSARAAKSDDAGWWKANFYAVNSTLDLYNNFTWFLNDPLKGDQFHQHDGRTMVGGNVSRTLQGTLGGVRTETTLGIQTRYDDIDLGLTNTFQRQPRFDPNGIFNVRTDRVREASVGIYAENTLYWTDWLRTTLGWRGDYYDGTVDSIFDANNSGHTKAAIGSPKFRMVLGPFNKTELFFGAGMGFHSNDARGATITESPTDPTTKLGRVAAARTHSRGRGRRSHEDRTGARFLGQPFHSRPGLRASFQRRRRRYIGEPSERALWRGVDQPLSPGVVGRYRCRPRRDPCPIHRLRQAAGRDLRAACRRSAILAGPDR
jgi:hypothetical protein